MDTTQSLAPAQQIKAWVETAFKAYGEYAMEEEFENGHVPAGWSFLGQGAFRSAFLNLRDGLVYKVAFDPDAGSMNLDEVSMARALRSLIKTESLTKIAVPEMHYVDGVVVSEYVDGAPFGCLDREERRIMDHACFAEGLRLRDLDGYNLMDTPGGVTYIIDLGHCFTA